MPNLHVLLKYLFLGSNKFIQIDCMLYFLIKSFSLYALRVCNLSILKPQRYTYKMFRLAVEHRGSFISRNPLVSQWVLAGVNRRCGCSGCYQAVEPPNPVVGPAKLYMLFCPSVSQKCSDLITVIMPSKPTSPTLTLQLFLHSLICSVIMSLFLVRFSSEKSKQTEK